MDEEFIKNLKHKNILINTNNLFDNKIAATILLKYLKRNNQVKLKTSQYFDEDEYLYYNLIIDIGHKPKPFSSNLVIFFNKYAQGDNIIHCPDSITAKVLDLLGLTLHSHTDDGKEFNLIGLMSALEKMKTIEGLTGEQVLKVLKAPFVAQINDSNIVEMVFNLSIAEFEPYAKLAYETYNGSLIGIYFGTSTYQYLNHLKDDIDSIVAIDIQSNRSCARILAKSEEDAFNTQKLLEEYCFYDNQHTLLHSNNGYMLSKVLTTDTIINSLKQINVK